MHEPAASCLLFRVSALQIGLVLVEREREPGAITHRRSWWWWWIRYGSGFSCARGLFRLVRPPSRPEEALAPVVEGAQPSPRSPDEMDLSSSIDWRFASTTWMDGRMACRSRWQHMQCSPSACDMERKRGRADGATVPCALPALLTVLCFRATAVPDPHS